jgi:N-acetylneuraminate synthase
VENFIHNDFKGNQDLRYIKKTEATKMEKATYRELANHVVNAGCIPMATPFDEKSVDLCVEFGFPIIKVASSDINDWSLIEKIASIRKPTIVSTGGASEKSIDEIVAYFEKRSIPLAINHCVSLYPSEDSELELNQIVYLKNRYPGHVIGFSSHEYHDWSSSMLISYSLGARTWERHIDIESDGIPVSNYCSLPHQIDTWFKAFHKSKEMLGGYMNTRRVISKGETEYLNALVRGIYAARDLPTGYIFNHETFNQDFYLAVPLRKKQLSTREVLNGLKLTKNIKVNQPLTIEDIDGPYNENQDLRKLIEERGY